MPSDAPQNDPSQPSRITHQVPPYCECEHPGRFYGTTRRVITNFVHVVFVCHQPPKSGPDGS